MRVYAFMLASNCKHHPGPEMENQGCENRKEENRQRFQCITRSKIYKDINNTLEKNSEVNKV